MNENPDEEESGDAADTDWLTEVAAVECWADGTAGTAVASFEEIKPKAEEGDGAGSGSVDMKPKADADESLLGCSVVREASGTPVASRL